MPEVTHDLFQYQIVEYHARQFEVGIGQRAAGVFVRDYLASDVCWELYPPDSWLEWKVSTEPHPARSESAGIAKADVVEGCWDQFADVSRASRELHDQSAGVEQGFPDFSVATQADKIWDSSHCVVEWREERLGCREYPSRVLEPPDQ